MRGNRLGELLQGLEPLTLSGGEEIPIAGISNDSRRVGPGFLFVCVRGFKDDGHRYIPEALARGAAALVVERPFPGSVSVPVIRVADARKALALLSVRFYDHPSARLTLIGVTGTQGKTTTTFLIEGILRQAGFATGLIGTVVRRVGEREEHSLLTTPESVEIQHLLDHSVRAGLTHVVMEVSSHALALHRVAGCDFDIAVFTNLTSDHLDLHRSRRRYLQVKSALFAQLGPDPAKCAVVNLDDPHSGAILEASRCRVLTYGLHREAPVMASEIAAELQSLRFQVHTPRGQRPVHTHLTGAFNVYNALAAVGVGLCLDVDLATIVRGLESVTAIPGRFELVDAGQEFLIVVDFAHTAVAMEQLLTTARPFAPGRIITVFGCPGERDKTKRPVIGQVVSRLSDHAIITSDNPASEEPIDIARAIEAGLRRSRRPCTYEILLDRAEAIARAVSLARPGDAVILAGKGHEAYQIMKTGLVPFSDREVVLGALELRKHVGLPIPEADLPAVPGPAAQTAS
jgi:UDP-N-acetylmuramoyl-L-alanyl-D-glutamate--2,6-diaminopimelate ligase